VGALVSTCDLSWLPQLAAFTGDWSAYCEEIHKRFVADFNDAPKPEFRGKPVSVPWRPGNASDGKSGTFWHLVSEGKEENDRTPDFRRCERLQWIRCLIDSADDTNRVNVWFDTTRGASDQRWKLTPIDYSYLVVLGDRGKYATLITAFCIEREHQREKLSNEHALARARTSSRRI
jgi:hypothetical protein